MYYLPHSIVQCIFPSFTWPGRFRARSATDRTKWLCTLIFQFWFLHYKWIAKNGYFLRSTPQRVGSRWIHAWQQHNRSYFYIVIVPVRSLSRFQKYVSRPSRYFHPNSPRSNWGGLILVSYCGIPYATIWNQNESIAIFAVVMREFI